MKALITGSSGFLGGYVTKRLRDEMEVEGVDLPTDLTVADDAFDVMDHLFGMPPDVVVHLAARAGANGKGGGPDSQKDPFGFLNNNVRVTLNVLEGMRRSRVRKLVYVSSISIHGPFPKCPIDESTPLNPDNAYALSKCFSEDLVRFYSTKFGIASVILRPSFISGEGQQEVNILRELVIDAVQGKPLEIWGAGIHQREFLHPSDVAEAIRLAVLHLHKFDAPGVVTLVLGNEPVSIVRLVEMVNEAVGSAKTEFKPPGPQAFSQITDHSKAEKVLGWRPRMGTSDILARVIEDVRRRLS